MGADPFVRSTCARLHREYLDGGTPLDPELAPAIVATVAASGGPTEYEEFFACFKHASNPQEEMRYLYALAGFEDAGLAERTFELARTEVRRQSAPLLVAHLLANRATGPATWARVTEHWDELLARFPATLVTRMLDGVRLLCRDSGLANEIRDFLAAHPVPTGEKAIAQTRERLGVNAAFATRLAAGAEPVLSAGTARLTARRAGSVSRRTDELIAFARSVKGFMPDEEGAALFDAALEAGRSRSSGATLVEIGAWCGKSTVYLGAACEASSSVLFSVDHHQGSEENQAGWDHHDLEVVDRRTGKIDTLPFWRRTIVDAGLGDSVVGLVGDSSTIASRWDTPVDFCFIDGGHGSEPAWADFLGWAPKIVIGGVLAIHDVFADPADGGRPPYELWCAALESGDFEEAGATGSLRLLRRVAEKGLFRRSSR